MTPRQADVAFVLESVPGIRAVYAIDHERVDFAIESEEGSSGVRAFVAAHYALLRVMSREDAARVCFVTTTLPDVFAARARLLLLTDAERRAARGRVPPPPAPSPAPEDDEKTRRAPRVLVVDEDQELVDTVREVFGCTPASPRCVVLVSIDEAVKLATAEFFDVILCDARRSFGSHGLLARLPLEAAMRELVLANPEDLVDARWRLQGAERILTRPLESWLLRDRVARVRILDGWKPDVRRVDAPRSARRLAVPSQEAPFRALLVGFDDDEIHDGLRRAFHGESRHTMCPDPSGAADIAFAGAFHAIFCSMRALLHGCAFLDAIAREDPEGADRVLVVARTSDVSYVKHKLKQMRRLNRVLASPVEDAVLHEAVYRRHAHLTARVAVDDAPTARPALPPSVRYRRLAVLLVDDAPTTTVLFAAADTHQGADVTLASTPMEAFEHVVIRPVDLLLVSATMRSDGAEPFYRVLWRLRPELKGRTVLVVDPEMAPASAPKSRRPLVLERPVTRDALVRVIAAVRQV